MTNDTYSDVAGAAYRVSRFLSEWNKQRGVDPAAIYSLHPGTDRAATLLYADLTRLVSASLAADGSTGPGMNQNAARAAITPSESGEG